MTHWMDLWKGNSRNTVSDWNAFGRNMDRFLEDFFHAAGSTKDKTSTFAPACDIEESDGQYLVTLDIPGVEKDAIKIEVVDNSLVVSAERKEEKKEQSKSQRVTERFYGKIERTFALPPGTNPEKIHAQYQNGVLKLSVPKAQSVKRKEIPIAEPKTQVESGKGTEKKETRPTAAA